jgi:Salmonella virulence plasmid 65kDa B protein
MGRFTGCADRAAGYGPRTNDEDQTGRTRRTMPDSSEQANSNPEAPAPTDRFFIQAPTLSLPKGGEAIRGIDEKLAANPATGTGSMTVPIATSPGRSGFGPQLTLSYDSGSANGPFGFGWSLSLPGITRKTDKGLPRYCNAEESDIFILSDAEDLVPVLVQDGQGNWIERSGTARVMR